MDHGLSIQRRTASADPAERIRAFLARESVIWLSTIREDGLPHLVPVWFWWDGQAILVYSKPHAVKVRALRAHPDAMVALGEPDDDFDVALLEVRAELLDSPPALPAGFVEKYRTKMPDGLLDPALFEATYTQAIRLVPTRWLPWQGRGPRHQQGLMTRIRKTLGALGSQRPVPVAVGA